VIHMSICPSHVDRSAVGETLEHTYELSGWPVSAHQAGCHGKTLACSS